MLLVHADSTCDVCLDPYNFDSGQSRFPYAIPCGHIFCLGCLESLSPAVCPLCRKAFTTERVKKLHMAAPDVNPEQAYVDRILDSWEAEQDDLVQLTTEVDNWLSAREGGSRKLRITRDAQANYHKLKTRIEQDKARLRHLERKLHHKDQNSTVAKETARAVEESLEMVISQLKAVVQAQQSEILNLKNELAVQSFSAGKGKGKLSNPLPAPPQPLSLDKYPRFVRDSIGPSPDFTQDPQFTRKILEWEAEWSRRSDFRNVPGPSESLAMAYAEARSQPVDPDSTDPKQRNVIVQGASPNSRVGPTRPLTTPVAPSEPPRRRRERPRESERRPRIYADQPEEPGPSSIRPVETVEFVNGFGQAYTAGYEAASRIGFRPDTSRRHTSDVGSSFTTTSGAMFPDSSSPGLHREPVQIPVVPVAPAPLSSRPRVVSFVDPPQAEAFDRRNPGSRPASDSFGTPRGAPSRGSSASWGTPRSVRTEASEAWFDSLHSFPAPGHPDSTLLASVERHGQTAGTTPRPRSNAPRSATAQPASTTEFGQTPMTNGFTRYQSSQLDPRLESLLADDHRLPSTSSISQTNPTSSTPQYQHPGIPNGQRMPPRRFSIQTDIPIVDDREFYPGPQPNYDPPLRSAPVGRIPRVTSSENNGNALGLNLNSDHLLPGTPTVVAPTPQFSTTPFLRSYSRD